MVRGLSQNRQSTVQEGGATIIIEKAKANKRDIGIGVAIAAAVIALLIGLVCCSAGGENGKDTAADIQGREVGAKGSSASSSSSSAQTSESTAPGNKGSGGEASNDIRATASDNGNGNGNGNIAQSHESDNNSDIASSGSNSANAPSSQEPQRRWVYDYENVWIVDSPAWTETVPIYESRERSICNICGADITGNTSAHGKEHMKAGEGSGHHGEVQRVQVGTNVINHPEEGHWESKIVGGHWE